MILDVGCGTGLLGIAGEPFIGQDGKYIGIDIMEKGRYHKTFQDRWIFDQSSYGSDAWFHPRWAKIPEAAIGVTKAGLERLTSNAGLKQIDYHQGNWKEVPGAFFQDVLVFEKLEQ